MWLRCLGVALASCLGLSFALDPLMFWQQCFLAGVVKTVRC